MINSIFQNRCCYIDISRRTYGEIHGASYKGSALLNALTPSDRKCAGRNGYIHRALDTAKW